MENVLPLQDFKDAPEMVKGSGHCWTSFMMPWVDKSGGAHVYKIFRHSLPRTALTDPLTQSEIARLKRDGYLMCTNILQILLPGILFWGI